MSKKKKKQPRVPANIVETYQFQIEDTLNRVFNTEDVISQRLDAIAGSQEDVIKKELDLLGHLAAFIDQANASDSSMEEINASITNMVALYITGRRNAHTYHRNGRLIDQACFERACLSVAKKPLH